jgi:SAM-dependent methyltransferase
MTSTAEQGLQAAIQAWDEAAWSLAALALTAAGDGPRELAAAAGELVAANGLTAAPGDSLDLGGLPPGLVANQAAASLHQASALVSGNGTSWSDQSDEALLAQGRASAEAARGFARMALPSIGDLSRRLATPGARMLDVGTGVGALALGYAEVFPQLQVVGIDVLDRALGLARHTLAASAAGTRVTVRKQDLAAFRDDAGFDLVWLPAPFIPPSALHAGLPRVAAALRPGGWLFMGHGKFGGTPVEDALTRLKTIAYGGTPLDQATAFGLLGEAGLTSVGSVPTPQGAPAITIGQKPA